MPKYKSVRRNHQGKLVYTYPREVNLSYRKGSFIAQKRQQAKRNATAKGLEFSVTTIYLKELWAKQDGVCALSGIEMGNIGDGYFSPSIDRIDSLKGYTEGNVQWTIWRVNDAKANMDNDEFIVMCQYIAERN